MVQGDYLSGRREMGSLEAEVLAQLWALGRPATPAEIREAMGTDLAYTTIMTILSRLWRKGLADRYPKGRAYAYAANVSEAELAARRMKATLEQAADREAALSRFVGSLSKGEERALRKIIGKLGRR